MITIRTEMACVAGSASECVRATCVHFAAARGPPPTPLAWDEKGPTNEHLEARSGTNGKNLTFF